MVVKNKIVKTRERIVGIMRTIVRTSNLSGRNGWKVIALKPVDYVEEIAV